MASGYTSLNLNTKSFVVEQMIPPPAAELGLQCFQIISIKKVHEKNIERANLLLKDSLSVNDLKQFQNQIIIRKSVPGFIAPLCFSLADVLDVVPSQIDIVQILTSKNEALVARYESLIEELKYSWREPAVEEITVASLKHYLSDLQNNDVKPVREDDSFFGIANPEKIGLEFTVDELSVLKEAAKQQNRDWKRAEWELFAQTWSEHCKHKIFAAQIESLDTMNPQTTSLFKTHIAKPTEEILARDPGRALSVFHDNSGVLPLVDALGQETTWAICFKMETHNSPSAISPYGGASTGIVGVHRDILGTGLGAMPVANWDVLCFENPKHQESRPAKALPADVIRKGVIHGIEDGGNQSGIPTVQGSVVFDPSYAVKPLVYAGSVGLLPKKYVHKKPKAGLKLYCVGGAVGADGLRGAVMSSRDLRKEDFSGSAVQVANAFIQRKVTDFLLWARDQDLIDCVTDNGAGGLASSVGEMASLANGAQIELSGLRLKYEGLLAWEYLLSESQERMTVATSQPENFEKALIDWNVGFDRLGELTNSGYFDVRFNQELLVHVPLKLLHEDCPKLKLKSNWTYAKELEFIENKKIKNSYKIPHIFSDFPTMLESEHLCSREGIVRKFDHEVQGRTLRKPFSGSTQLSPQDASLMEVHESEQMATFVLSHGLSPWRLDAVENTLHSWDEALRSAVIAGAQLGTLGALDNFSWPDPISPHAEQSRRLWNLTRSCETLSVLVRAFDIPLISGKDSMKNNSADFAVLETLVVSMGGSGCHPMNVPVGFTSRANDVLYWIPPELLSLKESAWARVFRARFDEEKNNSLGSNAVDVHKNLMALSAKLKIRYQAISSLILNGKIRSAKDISEGGLLMAAFEMSLGRNLGMNFLEFSENALTWFGEGVGGFLFAVDPHETTNLEQRLPEARRLGVVLKAPLLRWDLDKKEVSLEDWSKIYRRKSQEGFWG